MKIHTIWVQYEHDLMPNVMLAVDEYLMEDNPRFWDEEMDKLQKQGVLDHPWEHVVLEFPDAKIEQAFLPNVVVVEEVSGGLGGEV